MEDNITTAAVETDAQTADNAAAAQEVVAPAAESAPATEQQATEATAEPTSEGAQKARQSKEVNAQHKANRLKAEAISDGILDLARSKGLEPGDADEAVRMLVADYRAEEQMRKDLEAIRQVDPSVESLESLGDEFMEAVKKMDGLSAYYMIKGKEAVNAAAVPPVTGNVGSKTDTDRDFTSEELDRLNDADLKDKNVFQRAMRSMVNLGKKI